MTPEERDACLKVHVVTISLCLVVLSPAACARSNSSAGHCKRDRAGAGCYAGARVDSVASQASACVWVSDSEDDALCVGLYFVLDFVV
jgi:hypothetical protein